MKRSLVFLVIFTVICLISSVGADTFDFIAIMNSDFELPHPGNSSWSPYGNSVEPFLLGSESMGWIGYEAWWVGEQKPGLVEHVSTPDGWEQIFPGVDRTPYGDQFALMDFGVGFQRKLDGYVLEANTTYTIEFDLGSFKDNTGWLIVRLLAGGTGDKKGAGAAKVFTGGLDMSLGSTSGWIAAEQVDPDVGMQLGVADGWIHQSLSYTTGSNPDGLGETLSVGFYGDHNIAVDNVSLSNGTYSATAVTLTITTSSDGSLAPDNVIPAAGQYVYPVNTVVAVGTSDYFSCPHVYDFDRWEGDVSDPGSTVTTITLNENKVVNARFLSAAQCGDECHPIDYYDSDGDCDVDMKDFAAFAEIWLKCTTVECLAL